MTRLLVTLVPFRVRTRGGAVIINIKLNLFGGSGFRSSLPLCGSSLPSPWRLWRPWRLCPPLGRLGPWISLSGWCLRHRFQLLPPDVADHEEAMIRSAGSGDLLVSLQPEFAPMLDLWNLVDLVQGSRR